MHGGVWGLIVWMGGLIVWMGGWEGVCVCGGGGVTPYPPPSPPPPAVSEGYALQLLHHAAQPPHTSYAAHEVVCVCVGGG